MHLLVTRVMLRLDTDEVYRTTPVLLNSAHIIMAEPDRDDPERSYVALTGADDMMLINLAFPMLCRLLKEVAS